MSYHETLLDEINEVIDRLAEERQRWVASWIAQAICGEHGDIFDEGEDRDFWRMCGYQHVRKMVTDVINKRAGGDAKAKSKQLVFPGFERRQIQDYYVVIRDGTEQGVCILEMSDQEILEKAELHDSLAVSNRAHAN